MKNNTDNNIVPCVHSYKVQNLKLIKLQTKNDMAKETTIYYKLLLLLLL